MLQNNPYHIYINELLFKRGIHLWYNNNMEESCLIKTLTFSDEKN